MASLASYFCMSLLALQISAQQIAAPVNATYSPPPSPQRIQLESYPTATTTCDLVPLNPSTLFNASSSDNVKGSLNLLTADNTSPSSADLAVISCDPQDFSGSIDSPYLTNKAIDASARAIILYSTRSQQCQLTYPANNYANYFTAASLRDAATLLSLAKSAAHAGAAITTEEDIQAQRAQSGQHGDPTQSSGSGSMPSGGTSTTVAMIILYSITGIITLLFLLIIVTGALRAHRHPERYGPRNEQGAPRQSRARGIARAMLDTIPIVKFGENANPASKSTDIELAHSETLPRHPVQPRPAEVTPTPAPHNIDTLPAVSVHDSSDDPSGAADESGLVCSICTEEFEKGQDARMLPCKHKFHPACVDPWLLDVSGTCPLCRIDLRATDEEGRMVEASDEAMPPPLDPQTQPDAASNGSGGRLHALLRRLQPRTPEERLAALRLHRQEALVNSDTTAAAGTSEGRWQRAQRRLRRTARPMQPASNTAGQ